MWRATEAKRKRPPDTCPFKVGDMLKLIPGREMPTEQDLHPMIVQMTRRPGIDGIMLTTHPRRRRGMYFWWRFELATEEDIALAALIQGRFDAHAAS